MSTHQEAETTDQKIVKAITQIVKLPHNLRREAEEAGESAARKAEVEAWLKANRSDLDKRMTKLSTFLGLPIDPDKDAELKSLLQPILPHIERAEEQERPEHEVEHQSAAEPAAKSVIPAKRAAADEELDEERDLGWF